MLKGKTSIKLFDAKSGELTDSLESNNMVTNAVGNIFNGALNALSVGRYNGVETHNNLDFLFKLPNGMNIAKALFGGILVFSSNLEEDVNHIIPTMEEIKSCIGYANQGSGMSGNIFKGMLNTSESVVGSNYVTFVWDFTTEQCNGDIACVCLTSNVGGQLGFKFNTNVSAADAHTLSWIVDNMWDVATNIEFSGYYPHSPMLKSGFTNSNAHGSYVFEGNFYYVYRNSVYKYSIDRLVNNIGSNILERFSYGALSGYDDLITLPTTLTSVFPTVDDCVYEYRESTSNLSLTLMKVSGNAVNEYITIPTLNFITSLYNYFGSSVFNAKWGFWSPSSMIFNNKIYYLCGQINANDQVLYPNKLRMYILSFDGTFIYNDIDITANMVSNLFGTSCFGGSADNALGTPFLKMFDSLVLESRVGKNGYKYYMVDAVTGDISEYPFMLCNSGLSWYGNNLYKNSAWLKEPWCSFKYAGNGCYNTIDLWQTYLATINNTDYTLTKTPDKTMKIVYTLTLDE